MMNSRWQANKIGLINFWYYDEQEFPFVKGRMLLRGSNGSGKSVTMQSVVPLLLDGNMSPERLDPFGSRDRKMSSYLLEEDDGREERTGYLYLELKRQKYQGGREDAPRLISLDEAFAGVDNKNIRDMFRLMTEFQFDFIINSQVLWGDCDTLDALAIYQLIRPGNAKFVTVMPYLWNGHRKELLEHEDEVEQRGIEIGQAAGV